MSTDPQWSTFVSGSCVVCNKRLDYTVKRADGSNGIPEVIPNRDYVAYRDGHMCPECGALVASLVAAVRAQLKGGAR